MNADWQPAAETERYAAIDALRGAALFGVLMINLLGDFRISLFEHILKFHTDPGWANRLVDNLAAGLLEFKAIALFSFLFGVGAAIQVERAKARGIDVTRFLLRRFLALLLLGLAHALLLWNGDILTLYAVCGLLLTVPLSASSQRTLWLVGLTAIALPSLVPLPIAWPSREAMRVQAAAAATVYSQGGFVEILVFRWHEAVRFILPLLESSLPRTAGLMLWGAAAWRSGVLRDPQNHRRLLQTIVYAGGSIGGVVTALQVVVQSGTGFRLVLPGWVADFFGIIPLAFAYAATLLLWSTRPQERAAGLLAAAGRMAFTNYIVESIVFGFLFYGYGFGLFGRLGSAVAALIGIALYVAQLYLSRWWLERFHFGPLEWLWRSMTYGRRQPMRKTAACAATS
jgi:uncharacterized protein